MTRQGPQRGAGDASISSDGYRATKDETAASGHLWAETIAIWAAAIAAAFILTDLTGFATIEFEIAAECSDHSTWDCGE